MKKILAIVMAMAMLFALCATAFADDVITLRMADNQADGVPNVEGDKYFIDLVDKYTDGTVKIELYNNAVLGDETSCVDMLQLNTLDLCRCSSNAMSTACTTLNILNMPYVYSSDEVKYAALDGELGQTLSALLKEETGLVNLCYFFSAPRSFYTVNKPIRSIDDMKGLKIRVQDDAVSIAMMKCLGASATPMNYSEVYSALETGVIDGAENDLTSYYSAGHYEVAKYYSFDMHTAASSFVVMSAGAWDSLSEAQQEAVMKAAAEASQYQRTLVDDYVAKARAAVEEAGCELIDVDTLAFQEAVAPMWDQYPELVPYRDMVG